MQGRLLTVYSEVTAALGVTAIFPRRIESLPCQIPLNNILMIFVIRGLTNTILLHSRIMRQGQRFILRGSRNYHQKLRIGTVFHVLIAGYWV